jgi:hypothetical protein
MLTMSLLPVICGTIAHCDRTIQGNNATDVTPETTMEAAKQMKLKLQKYKDHLRGWLPRLALFLERIVIGTIWVRICKMKCGAFSS